MPIDQETFDALKGLWIAAGGPAGSADLAAAIAFAESTGCQYALAGPVDIRPVAKCHWNVTHGENSCGYWQINLWAHPTYHAPAIFDAYTNARAAILISNHGTDFGAWSTYTNGAYRTYLAQYAGDAPGQPPPPADSETGIDASNLSSLRGWRSFTKAVGRTMPGDLASSQRARRDTLRVIGRARKVR